MGLGRAGVRGASYTTPDYVPPLTLHLQHHSLFNSVCRQPGTGSKLVNVMSRGVATGWSGVVDMSTPLLPQVVPEIDAVPVSFYSRGGGWVSQLPGV